ncbi:MAG: hypothetical protein R2939_01080 [Kofleriaceae bacterium]
MGELLELCVDDEPRASLGDARRRRGEVLARDVDRAAGVRQLAGEHLVEDEAEREDVGAVIDRVGHHLLGRHVVRRAHHHALAGEPLARIAVAVLVEHQRDAEVDHPRVIAAVVAALDDDVGRLEVPVDQAAGVGVSEPAGDAAGDVEHARARHRAELLDQVGEVDAVGEVHRQVQEAGRGLADVDDADQVGVVEARRRLGLVGEALALLGLVGEVAEGDLDREAARHPQVAGPVHAADAAVAEQRLDLVALAEHRADQGIGADRQRRAVARARVVRAAKHRRSPCRPRARAGSTTTPSAPRSSATRSRPPRRPSA